MSPGSPIPPPEQLPRRWTRLLAAADLAKGIDDAGTRIRQDYQGEEIVLVGLLQGGLFFLADLARAIAAPVHIETMLPRSYGNARASSGMVELLQDLQADIHGRHVLIVEDIYDSGRTLRFVSDRLATRAPKSLAIACLLVKDAPRAAEIDIKYPLFRIPNVFVVGAGLDFAGIGRNLPDLWAMPPGLSEQTALDQLRLQLGSAGELDPIHP